MAKCIEQNKRNSKLYVLIHERFDFLSLSMIANIYKQKYKTATADCMPLVIITIFTLAKKKFTTQQ